VTLTAHRHDFKAGGYHDWKVDYSPSRQLLTQV
jgi:hypothetical protein